MPSIATFREDVNLLPTNIERVAERQVRIERILGGEWWTKPTFAAIDEAREALAPIMRFRKKEPARIVEFSLDDIIDSRKWVVVKNGEQREYVEEYRKRVEDKIQQLALRNPTIQKLAAGELVALDDLLALEGTLEQQFITVDVA